MKAQEQLENALRVAFRHYQECATSEAERVAILESIVATFTGYECEVASQILFHIQQARKQQLELQALLSRAAFGLSERASA